jgi:hypothetical protein
MSEVEVNTNRARPDRATAIASERGRRKPETLDRMNGGFRMDFLERDQLDLDKFVYRYVIDDAGNRIHHAFMEDYDFVSTDEIKNFNAESTPLVCESSQRLSVAAGRDQYGNAERGYLMKKRRDWWENDQEVGVRRREDMMAGIVREGDVQALGNQNGLNTKGLYSVGKNTLGGAAKHVGPTGRR